MGQRGKVRALNREVIPSGIKRDRHPKIPLGDILQVQWVLFSDQNIGDNKSGGFVLEWGKPGEWELIHAVYLTGGAVVLQVNKAFVGDAEKCIRITRENNSDSSKTMIVVVEGFIRTGD